MQFFLVNFSVKQLLFVGAHIGCLKFNWNNSISFYLLGFRNLFCIFDLEQVIFLLRKALAFLTNLSIYREQFLIISKESIYLNNSFKFKQPFLKVKPFGGTLSNLKEFHMCLRYLNRKQEQPFFYIKAFNQILLSFKLVGSFKMLKNKKKVYNQKLIFWFLKLILRYYKFGLLSSKYSLSFKKQLKLFSHEFCKRTLFKKNNITFLKYLYILKKIKVPSGAFLSDVTSNYSIILECIKLQIPVIGLVDSPFFLNKVTYPILCNTRSLNSVLLYLKLISSSILKGFKLEKLILNSKVKFLFYSNFFKSMFKVKNIVNKVYN